MIFDDLKKIAARHAEVPNRSYLLNLLKEKLQDYILNFTYTQEQFHDLIFTGGTCLKKVYGLNRLSVDIDFDHETKTFSHSIFAKALENWFIRIHHVDFISTVVRKDTVKVKLSGRPEMFLGTGKDVLFVSVDISPLTFKKYGTEKNLVSTPEFSFFVKNFDLPTLFSNKICAFLERRFFSGAAQVVSFKARDVYDLFWLCQRSRENQYHLKPNFERLFEALKTTDKRSIQIRLIEKLNCLEDKQLASQLLPFFSDQQFVQTFVTIYKKNLANDFSFIFS